jgi:hypothetical protein
MSYYYNSNSSSSNAQSSGSTNKSNLPVSSLINPNLKEVPENATVVSGYTGKFVAHGPVQAGLRSDAPPGNERHNQPFTRIVENSNGDFEAFQNLPNRK